jgi:hypothetical protein
MPGTSYDEAARAIAGELPELPHLPDLPGRGVGADPVGRAIGLLVDLPAEVVPSGWRLSRRPGIDARRALDERRRAADAAEEHLSGADWVKVQVLGPWSLAAMLELPSGHRVVTDPAAVQDIAASLLEGLLVQVADLSVRTGDAGVVVQVEEPMLAAVLAGTLPTASGFGTVRSVDAVRVRDLLTTMVSALGTPTVVRAGSGVPVRLLREAGFAGLAVDLTSLGTSAAELDPLGEAIEAGVVVLAGVAPTAAAAERSFRDRAAPLLDAWRRWGFPLSDLPGRVVPTPVDGLAAVTFEVAVQAMRDVHELARALADPPDDW